MFASEKCFLKWSGMTVFSIKGVLVKRVGQKWKGWGSDPTAHSVMQKALTLDFYE